MPASAEAFGQFFGSRVREYRDNVGFTQREVAADMQERGHDWHQSTVLRTETGQRPIRLEEALDLAQVLRVNLDDLVSPPVDENDAKRRQLGKRLIEADAMLAVARRKRVELDRALAVAVQRAESTAEELETLRAAQERTIARRHEAAAEIAEIEQHMTEANQRIIDLKNYRADIAADLRKVIPEHLSLANIGRFPAEMVTGARIANEAGGYIFEVLSSDESVSFRSGSYSSKEAALEAGKEFLARAMINNPELGNFVNRVLKEHEEGVPE